MSASGSAPIATSPGFNFPLLLHKPLDGRGRGIPKIVFRPGIRLLNAPPVPQVYELLPKRALSWLRPAAYPEIV